jgi:hypothetical protein
MGAVLLGVIQRQPLLGVPTGAGKLPRKNPFTWPHAQSHFAPVRPKSPFPSKSD